MSYERSAAYYDLFDTKGNVDYYVRLALETGGPALDLGCGTGRVAVPMARRGVRVTGVDVSPAMLGVFRRKLSEEPPEVRSRVDVVQADFTRIMLDRRFAFACVPSSGLEHCLTQENLLQALRVVRGHLEPCGLLAFDVTGPGSLCAPGARRGGRALSVQCVRTPSGDEIIRRVSTSAGSDGLVHVVLEYEVRNGGEKVDAFVERAVASIHTVDEIDQALSGAGFEVRSLRGGFDGSPLEADSPYTVVEAVAT